MVDWVEVELKIAGSKEDNEKLLLSQGYVLFYKRRIITNYYLPPDVDENSKGLKDKCVRIRKSVRLDKDGTDVDGVSLFNKKKEPSDRQNIKQEKQYLKAGYKHILTDDKYDWVFMHKEYETNRIAFQLQDIKGIGLIVAYFNKNYYGKPHKEQTELLIKDIENVGIKILSKKQVDRFKIVKDKNKQLFNMKQVRNLLSKEKQVFLFYDFANSLKQHCCADTCYLPIASYWTKDNPFYGHCAIVALSVYDKFGGKIKRGIIKENNLTHYCNEINGVDYDFTIQQFKEDPTIEFIAYKTKKEMLKDADFKLRYKNFKKKG